MPTPFSIPQWVPQKVCLACDGCCRFKDEKSPWRPKVFEGEASSPTASALVQKIFSPDHLNRDRFLKTVQEKGVCRCTFFNLQENTCTIYPHRPFECQLYPFLLTKKKEALAIYVHLACPHIQETYEDPAFQGFVGRLKNFFAQKEILVFLQKNRDVISDYSAYADEIAFLFDVNA